MQEKIEILSVDLLIENHALANELKRLNYVLGLSSGWHYLLDWIWVIQHLNGVSGKKILDAGAGTGLIQWYLALKNADVISVDRSDRRVIPHHLLRQFNIDAYTPKDEILSLDQIFNPVVRNASLLTWVKSLFRGAIGAFRARSWKRTSGKVWFYRTDLQFLTEVPDNTVDYVVSISAVEHNPPETLRKVVDELERTLKPGGAMLVTVPAARDSDWYFEPASAWCYTDTTLRDVFRLSPHASSNYHHYDDLLEKLTNSKELRSNMTWYYYYSPRSGMPWGIWRPRYQPVGIVKVKPS